MEEKIKKLLDLLYALTEKNKKYNIVINTTNCDVSIYDDCYYLWRIFQHNNLINWKLNLRDKTLRNTYGSDVNYYSDTMLEQIYQSLIVYLKQQCSNTILIEDAVKRQKSVECRANILASQILNELNET